MGTPEEYADWASLLALDLMSVAFGNPYKLGHRLIAEHLREVEARGAVRGAQEMADNVHRRLDQWMGISPPDRTDVQ
jgi:hypothetical protein